MILMDAKKESAHIEYSLTVAGAFLFALFLRLWHLGARSLWLDEGCSYTFARATWPNLIAVVSGREINMAIYYAMLKPYLAVVSGSHGVSEFLLRLPGAAAGAIAVPLVGFLGAKLFQRWTGGIASLLFAGNALAMVQSRQARGYGILLLETTLQLIIFLYAVKRNRRSDWALWTAMSVAGIYIHLFSVLATVAQGTACLFVPGVFATGTGAETVRRKILPWLACSLAVIMASAVPVVLLAHGMSMDPLVWIPPLTLPRFVSYSTCLIGFGTASLALAAVALTVAFIQLLRSLRTSQNTHLVFPLALVICGVVVPTLIAVAGSLLWHAMFFPRFLVVITPSLALFFACALTALPWPWLRIGGTAILLSLAVGPLCEALLPETRHFNSSTGAEMNELALAWETRQDFRAATTRIAALAQPGDAIVIWEPLGYCTFAYYRDRMPQANWPRVVLPPVQSAISADALNIQPDVPTVDAIAHQYRRIWLLDTRDSTYSTQTIWERFLIRRIALEHHKRSEVHFERATVYEWERE